MYGERKGEERRETVNNGRRDDDDTDVVDLTACWSYGYHCRGMGDESHVVDGTSTYSGCAQY